tara:strand:+ start:1299 stop:1448 length:150 start_codon:yes stop_codon:yes gene_type:complete
MDSTIDILHILKKKIELEGDKLDNQPDVQEKEKKKPKKSQKQIFEIKKT